MSVFGVGFNGVGKYSQKENRKEYNVWVSMLRRCYNDVFQLKRPTYIGCSVCVEWLNFQVFAEWYNIYYIEGFQIDKDLLIKGNKIYSPDNCSFLPSEINNGLQTNREKNSTLPTGINKRKCGNFEIRCNIENSKRTSNSFSTIDEAVSHYKQIKESYIKRLAEKHKEKLTQKSYNALMVWEI